MQTIYIKYSRNRFPQFQIETSIINDHSTKYVVKRALSEEAYPHIESIYQGFNFFKDAILDDRIKQPSVIEKQDDRIVFEFIEGANLNQSIFELFLKKDKARYLERIDQYHELLFGSLKTVKQFHLTKEADVFFKDIDIDSIENEKYFFPYAFIDMAPDNLITTSDESYYFIDYEWILPATFPVSFVFFRSLFLFYVLNAAKYGIENFLPFDDLMCRYGVSQSQIVQYSKIEKNIQNYISGKYRYNRDRYLKKRISLDDLIQSIDGTHQSLVEAHRSLKGKHQRLGETYQHLLETHQSLMEAHQCMKGMMSECEEKLQQWVREREYMVSQCEQHSKGTQEILHSTSWRLTRPLRWLEQMLSGLIRRLVLLRRAWALVPWIRTFKVRDPLRFLRHYFLIEQSMLFDPVYYLAQNPDLPREGFDFLAHYVALGGKENLDPNPLFDTQYYRRKFSHVLSPEDHPLVHYIAQGAAAGFKPHPLFDTAYYFTFYPDIAAVGINPLAHYLHYGAQDRRNPHPLFDTAYYLLRVPELNTTGVNPLVHFLKEGAKRGIKPHPLFYPFFYLEKYPDVTASGINPLIHFVENGGQEGYDPNPMFDALYYLEKNPDVAQSGQNVLVHYLESGAQEGRDPHPFFNTTYYAKMNHDVIDAGYNPLAHYVEYGLNERRSPYNLYGDVWVQSKRLTSEDLLAIKTQIDRMTYQPVFSVIVPVYNTDERWLRRCLESVLLQLYPHWELCIADDASTAPHVREVLAEYAAKDSRIRVVYQKENGHISAASNAAMALAQGEFIALLDHDDEIAIDALYENAALLNVHPDADMIYSDEDKISEEGIRHMPFFKPDWSPDTFLSQMYSGHLGIYRAEIIRRIGGFRIGFEGSQDYDLVLRFTEQTSHIYHIPRILYHWRTIQGSTAREADSKNYAYVAAKKAIQEALDRRGEGGQVDFVPGHHGQYRARYPIRGNPLVSIIIPTHDNGPSLEKCLASIFGKTTYPFFEVLIVDNGSVKQEMKSLFDRWKNMERDRFRVVSIDIPFNYSRLNNEGVRHASGDILVLLNDDTEVISVNWLEEMAGQAQRETIGAVGAILLYPDDTIQHAGLILGGGGVVNHSHKYAPASSPGYFGRLLISANYAAVTGTCLMVTKERYLNIGGLDEGLAVAYSDVDFCLRLLQKGYRNIVLPHVRLYHHESRSHGDEETADRNKDRLQQDMKVMETRWRDFIADDPYYNPNLTKARGDYSLPVIDHTLDIRLKLQRELLRDPVYKKHEPERPDGRSQDRSSLFWLTRKDAE